jgi:hypothetical protein
MRRLFITPLVILISFMGLAPEVTASPGDTTWVTVFNNRWLDHNGNFDTTAVLPASNRYRKIRMHYILGRYACPGSPQYCGSWDYTTQVFTMPGKMDTLELAKVITPYATDWLSRNISHDFVIDVTDYASALHDTTGIRFKYDGYSWGFTITLKLEFIEGIPPMDVLSVENIYNGYFPYGNNANPIENYLTSKTFSFTTNVNRVFIKNSVSGHGADPSNCSEFCSKYYNLKIDNNPIAQKQLWRNDCGRNPISPQTGTWIYDRANWCPGAEVLPIFHDISIHTLADTPFDVDIDMQPYTSGNPKAGYNFVSQLFTYGPENHSIDVSLEKIVAPRSDAHYYLHNSACMNPVVRIKNTGYDSINIIIFEYGIRGLVPNTYTWTGSVGFLQEATLVFPASTPLMSQAISHNFDVRVISVNGMAGDQYTDNNLISSRTATLATLPREFVVRTKTNLNNKPATNINQTKWILVNDIGDTVASRLSMSSNTFFRDSLFNLADGCYKFTIDDAGCNGFSWWANAGGGHGTITINSPASETILHTFSGDFGCTSSTYFFVGNRPALPPEIDYTGLIRVLSESMMRIYPNPASSTTYLSLQNTNQATMEIRDLTGRLISAGTIPEYKGSTHQLDVSGLENGIYFVSISAPGVSTGIIKLVVQH